MNFSLIQVEFGSASFEKVIGGFSEQPVSNAIAENVIHNVRIIRFWKLIIICEDGQNYIMLLSCTNKKSGLIIYLSQVISFYRKKLYQPLQIPNPSLKQYHFFFSNNIDIN